MRKSLSKILVTGGAGFIGSAFVRLAIAQGYEVFVLDALTYAGDLARLASVKDKFVFYKGDICNKAKVAQIMKDEKPDAIIHFAAESHVDRSICSSDEFIQTNIVGTQVLLDAAKSAGTGKFVYVSTDEVYGEIESGKFTEDSIIAPNSPYSASKAAGDLLVRSYVRTFNFPAVIVRPSNNFGPWQYPEKFVPVAICKVLDGEKIPVYAKGLNVREWLYVDDCARAIMCVLEKGVSGEAYNIGSGNERKNIDVARAILESLGRPLSDIEFVKDRPGHDFRYSLDSKKIMRDLGWKPEVNFADGMSQTIKWYKDNAEWLMTKREFLQAYWKKIYRSA